MLSIHWVTLNRKYHSLTDRKTEEKLEKEKEQKRKKRLKRMSQYITKFEEKVLKAVICHLAVLCKQKH